MRITIDSEQKCIFVEGEKDLKLLTGILQGISYMLSGYDLICLPSEASDVDFEDEVFTEKTTTEQFRGIKNEQDYFKRTGLSE